jgi:hypothetical protein
MVRLWLIRSLALTLLTLCIMAWVGSYFQPLEIGYRESYDYFDGVALSEGRIFFFHDWYSPSFLPPPKFSVRQGSADNFPNFEAGPDLGFGLSRSSYHGWLAIPFWFITVLTLVSFYFALRITRVKAIVGGFPIEPTAKST